MAASVLIPDDLWEGDTQCVITNWLAADGGQVKQGAPIVEIMVEKAQFEIAAPASGALSIEAEVDDVVSKGDLIGLIE